MWGSEFWEASSTISLILSFEQMTSSFLIKPWVEIDNCLWLKTSFVMEIAVESELITFVISSLFNLRDSSATSFSLELVKYNAITSKKGRRIPKMVSSVDKAEFPT